MIKSWDIDTRDGQDDLFFYGAGQEKSFTGQTRRTFIYLNFSTQDIDFPMTFFLQMSVFSNLKIRLQFLSLSFKLNVVLEGQGMHPLSTGILENFAKVV